MFEQVLFSYDAVDDGCGREPGVVRHSMDLRLEILEIAAEGVDQHDAFELRPVEFPHVRDASDVVIDCGYGLGERSPQREAYGESSFDQHKLGEGAAILVSCAQCVPDLTVRRHFADQFALRSHDTIKAKGLRRYHV